MQVYERGCIKFNDRRSLEMMTLGCLGMLFVLYGHFGVKILDFNGLFKYDSFHMPLFMFISGYFYNDVNDVNLCSCAKYVKSKIKKLVVPFLLWYIVYFLVALILQSIFFLEICNDRLFTIRHFFEGLITVPYGFIYNVASWFIMPLVICEVLNVFLRYLIRKITYRHRNKIILILYLGIAYLSIVGAESAWCNSGLRIALVRNMYLLFFYGTGYAWNFFERKVSNMRVLIIPVVLTSCILLDKCGDYVPIVYNMRFDNSVNPGYYILRAILGILFWTSISYVISPMISDSKFVVYFYKNRFSIMMHQGIVGLVINIGISLVKNNREKLEYFRFHIWGNSIDGYLSILIPTAVIAVILSICRLTDFLKEKYINMMKL